MRVAVISLAQAAVRRENIRRHLGGSKVDWFFWDANDGKGIQEPGYDGKKALRYRGYYLANGEIGCFRSHWLLWKHFLSEMDDPWLCVIEDDVLIDVNTEFDGITRSADALGIEYIRLAGIWLQPFVSLGYIGRRQLVRYRSSPFGTQAYLISKAGAARMLASIPEICRPIDDEMDQFWRHNLPLYAVHPYPSLDTGVTDPMKGRKQFSHDRTLLDRIAFKATYAKQGVLRRMANIGLTPRDRAIRKQLAQASFQVD